MPPLRAMHSIAVAVVSVCAILIVETLTIMCLMDFPGPVGVIGSICSLFIHVAVLHILLS